MRGFRYSQGGFIFSLSEVYAMKLRVIAAFLCTHLACWAVLPAQAAQATQPTQLNTPSAPTAAAPARARRRPLSEITAASGGAPDQVWVNTASRVYHCPGTAYYGKTKAGKYMTEEAAKAENDRADHGRPCKK